MGYQGQPDREVSWSPEHMPPSRPFFPTLELADGHPYQAARTPSQPHPWAAEKPEGVRRYLALGGSAVHGYGHFRAASWPDKLEDALAEPGDDVEVLNLGAIAWSSQQLVTLMKEAEPLEADGVLIYAGNNEMLEWAGARRYLPPDELRAWVRGVTWARRLRGLRLYRLLAEELQEQPGVYGQTDFREVEPLPEDQRARISEADLRFAEVQLRSNLERIVELAGDTPVFVAVPALNLDYPPAETEPACVPEHAAATEMAVAALREGRLEEALDLGEEAFEACPEAKQAWLWGQALREQGHPGPARPWLERAMLLDSSPNRVGPHLQQVVRELGGVTRVDGSAALEALSPDGLIGWSEIYDHCHPDAEAHTALAQAFAEAMGRDFTPGPRPLPGHVDADEGPEERPLNPELEREGWWQASLALHKSTAEDWTRHGALAWQVHDGSCLRGRQACLDEAEAAFLEALRVDPEHCLARANLGRLYFAVDHPLAEATLAAAVACEPDDARSAWYLARLRGR